MQKIRGLFYLLVVLCCAGTLRADGLPKGFEVGDEVVIIWQVNNVLAGGSTYPYRIEEIDGKWIKMMNLEEKKLPQRAWYNSDYISFITHKAK